jgi:signal transduction histidine kinase
MHQGLEPADERLDIPASLNLITDPAEARAGERVIAVARALLSVAAIFVVSIDPLAPSHYAQVTSSLLFLYAAFAMFVLAGLMRATKIPNLLPLVVHIVDMAFAVALTLFSDGPNGPLSTFLFYPLLGAGYRWGFREVMATAGVLISAMGVEVLMGRSMMPGLTSDAFELNRFLLRGIYIAAMAAAVGYLAENEKRRRFEARNVSLVLARARLGGRFGDTVNLVLASLQSVFNATHVLLAIHERNAGRTWLWSTSQPLPTEDEEPTEPQPFPEVNYHDYFFPSPGAAFHAVRRIGRRGRFSAVAIDQRAEQVTWSTTTLPARFLEAHPCRRLIGVTLPDSDEWSGRLIVLGPGPGVRREQSARFALHIANHVGPALYSHYRVRHLRLRAEALERGRLARELHDGLTQSLVGLEMELVVLHRRAVGQAPELADDLGRVHQIVRKEIIAVRELMEGIRAGDVESSDLLHHLSEIVDRFSRHTGIAARFVSDGAEVAVTPHVRRQIARIVHEALVNIRKHADADRVVVRADLKGAWWNLSIEDDGRGFPFAGRLAQPELDQARQGPRTIGERIRLIGGSMIVESRPGFGACLELAIPLKATP